MQTFLGGLPPDQLESTIAELEVYEDEYPVEAVEPACAVLLDIMPKLRTEQRGMFDFGADLVVKRVVLRLLRRIGNEEDRLATVKRILARLQTLHARYALLTLAGHHENAGHQLIPLADAHSLENNLRTEIAATPAADLVTERNLSQLLWWCIHPTDDDAQAPVVPALESPEVREKLLRQAVTASHSQTMGSRAVRTQARLTWEPLLELFGGEQEVRELVERLRGRDLDADLARAVELAEEHLAGRVANDEAGGA